jgi:hypothetical protein
MPRLLGEKGDCDSTRTVFSSEPPNRLSRDIGLINNRDQDVSLLILERRDASLE